MGLFDFAKNSLGDVPSGFGGRGDIASIYKYSQIALLPRLSSVTSCSV